VLLALTPPAVAAPPLLRAADMGEPGMQVWWQANDLLAGNPDAEGRPGLRPLVADSRLSLPVDLSAWSRIGETCTDEPSAQGTLHGVAVKVTVVTDPTAQQVVRLVTGETVLAENTLGRPATVCSIHLVEADNLPGPEILISWRLAAGTDEPMIQGLTVFRVPETARY
jgi:hypothetical protein